VDGVLDAPDERPPCRDRDIELRASRSLEPRTATVQAAAPTSTQLYPLLPLQLLFRQVRGVQVRLSSANR
jgi:hypothetical protein